MVILILDDVTIGLHAEGDHDLVFVRNRHGRGGYDRTTTFDTTEERDLALLVTAADLIESGFQEM